MTDAEKYVKSTWPEADCFKTKLYWPGQGERLRWIVTRAGHWSGVDGEGITKIAAWADAANRLEAKRGGGHE